MIALIAAQRDEHQIPHATACRALGVSRSWFYKHKRAELSPRAARREALAAEIGRLFRAHRGTYGSPRITADLREAGWQVSENTVAVLMREQGLAARRKKKRRSTTRAGKGRWRAADLVKRHPELSLTKVVVSEAGASVYSASAYASQELPGLDVSLRGAVSIPVDLVL